MTEERITLSLYGEKLVWNRYVKYVDYDLMGSKVLIRAGNEQHWMKYLETIQFTSDFSVMVTSDNLLTSVSLLIIYNAPATRFSCSGAPLWRCSESINGQYATINECVNACKGDPGCVPDWKCEIPRNGYSNDGCGSRRLDANCDPLPGDQDDTIWIIAVALVGIYLLMKGGK